MKTMHISANSNHLTGFEVITETREILGWVKNTICSEDDTLFLIISILSISWLPKVFIGSYQLPTSEIVSFGTNRIIVFEGAEDRLICQTVSLLERIGLVQPPWCKKGEWEAPIISMNDSWDDDEGSTGTSPVPVPREPGPSPMNAEVKAQRS
jgi:hypothetical protein